MDATVVGALIGATGAILAALIAARLSKKDRSEDKSQPTVSTGAITGENVVISGRDSSVVIETETRPLSRIASSTISKIADEVIQDQELRFRWSSFDVQFLTATLKNTHRGWAFDGAAAKGFLKKENDPLFFLSVKIYDRVSRLLLKDHPKDSDVCAKIAEWCLSARFLLRDMSYVSHPNRSSEVADYSSLWDGSEVGWCLIQAFDDVSEEPQIVIFNHVRRIVLVIDNPATRDAVVAQMKDAGIPTMTAEEAGFPKL